MESNKTVNEEIGKVIGELVVELCRLRVENVDLINKSLRIQDEILDWQKKFVELDSIHSDHSNFMSELQKYGNTMKTVYENQNYPKKVTISSDILKAPLSFKKWKLRYWTVCQKFNCSLYTINEENLRGKQTAKIIQPTATNLSTGSENDSEIVQPKNTKRKKNHKLNALKNVQNVEVARPIHQHNSKCKSKGNERIPDRKRNAIIDNKVDLYLQNNSNMLNKSTPETMSADRKRKRMF